MKARDLTWLRRRKRALCWRSHIWAGLFCYLCRADGDAVLAEAPHARPQDVRPPNGAGERDALQPAKILSSTTEVMKGNPNPKYISTSYVERQNLTMRMHMRPFTRLTNTFSKKIENHAAAVALHYMWYNIVCVHETLRVTAAMEAAISSHVWSLAEIVGLLDAVDKKAA
jgi:hypothetical protein